MGASLAKELRSPTPGSCMGWVAQRIMSMGSGADSIDAVAQLGATPAANPVIVEVGPGSGYSLRTMFERLSPSRVYGIEISEAFRNQLAADKELAPFQESGVLSLHGADAKDLDFVPDNSVDIFFAFNVIYFLDPLDGYMKECFRVVKPGGCVMFCVKEVAKTLDQSIYINTDWDKCLEEMSKAGFEEVKAQDERLEGPLAYTPLVGKKPE